MNAKAEPLTAQQERDLLLIARNFAGCPDDSAGDREKQFGHDEFMRLKSESASLLRAHYKGCESMDEFIEYCAIIDVFKQEAEAEAAYYRRYAGGLHRIADLLTVAITRASDETKAEVADLLTGNGGLAAKIADIGGALSRKRLSDKAINARHNKEGGSRDLKAKIRDIWATGKYLTKDLCAEEEYRALGINTLGTARGYLTGEPDPNPWPAKEQERLAKQQAKGKKK